MTYTREQIIENRKKWAADLRSNRYSQCRGTICNGVGYCCLGVAAVGLGRKVERLPPEMRGDAADKMHGEHYDAVDEAMGIEGGDFIHANDHDLESFLQIADMVDALPTPAEAAP